MDGAARTSYEDVSAAPVKSFFVSMLTRDIKLEDAILDLLDNCVDGILRTRKAVRRGPTPYAGFRAEIEFDHDSFTITDNCGGIPWTLHDYAFRMGRARRPDADAPGTVGVYGIGMKRAIFKMGRRCDISTQNGGDRYTVEFTPSWMDDEEKWHVPVRPAQIPLKRDGTTVSISSLHPGIRRRFGEEARDFRAGLADMVATHYAFIIDKGFEVRINGGVVRPRPTRLLFDDSAGKTPAIRPFMFRTKTSDGVDVFLAVGFTRPIPSEDEVQREQDEIRYSSLDAGWTVVCNDRAVLYCDRSELTGWGEAGVPRYHTQFTAISGIVEFRADDASKLPTTTTKRGIDASSALYLQVKNKMREGMRLFTDYTNKWKGRADESKRHIEAAGDPLSLEEVKARSHDLTFSATTRSVSAGKQYKPDLPMPRRLGPRVRRIAFTREDADVRAVAAYVLDDPDAEPSATGGRCFDLILREARR
jgi:hypothetical protein